jgi:hypothetical protein
MEIVPIEYTVPQIHAIQRLNITKTSHINYCGYTHSLDMDRIIEWFKSIGSNSEEDCVICSRLISDIVQMVCGQADSCLLTIRSSVASDFFTVPRFHRDGKYYTIGPNQIQRKFILTIKGPGTLLSEPNEQITNSFFDVFYNPIDQMDENKRKQMAEILGPENIFQLTNNQGAWIITYQTNENIDRATIHSEPNITQPRLFFSVLPGTNEQIESIRSKNCK